MVRLVHAQIEGDWTPVENDPLYMQVTEDLRGRIIDGEFGLDERLPSESELCSRYLTTRGTIRRALGVLVSDGYVQRKQGRGSFVTSPVEPKAFWGFGGLTDRLKESGSEALAQVLDTQIVVRQDRALFRLKRLRLMTTPQGDEPISLDVSYVPLDIFPNIDKLNFSNQSLYRKLTEHYGRTPTSSRVALSPRHIDRETRTELRESSTLKCLLHASSRTYDQNDIWIEDSEVTYSSRVRAVMKINNINANDE